MRKVKVIGQGRHTFHIGGHAWRIGVKCDVWPCLARNISASQMGNPGSFAIFDRPLVVLQDWRVSSLQLFPFYNYTCVKLAPDAMWPLSVGYAKFTKSELTNPKHSFAFFRRFVTK